MPTLATATSDPAACAVNRELQYAPEPSGAIAVLAVTASDAEWTQLQNLFTHSHWRVERRRSIAEARELLLASCVPAVLCGAALPDGEWIALMDFLSHFRNPPRIVVLSDHADDRLWNSVLTKGAWALLEKPLGAAELYSAVSSAWRDWHAKTAGAPHQPVAPAHLDHEE